FAGADAARTRVPQRLELPQTGVQEGAVFRMQLNLFEHDTGIAVFDALKALLDGQTGSWDLIGSRIQAHIARIDADIFRWQPLSQLEQSWHRKKRVVRQVMSHGAS